VSERPTEPHLWEPGGMDAKRRTVCLACGRLWEDAIHEPSRRRARRGISEPSHPPEIHER
jgi:hypothetical protein